MTTESTGKSLHLDFVTIQEIQDVVDLAYHQICTGETVACQLTLAGLRTKLNLIRHNTDRKAKDEILLKLIRQLMGE